MNFKNISIEYHYLDLPAPFSYTKKFSFTISEDSLVVDYAMEYTDREYFSLEELEDEGFSDNDNENWKGAIHKDWLLPLIHLCNLKSGESADSANECIVSTDGTVIETYGQESKWDYYIQEITQAIYETAGWETPLNIRYCKKTSADKAPIESLQISFKNRTVQRNIAIPSEKLIIWETTQPLLELYYLQEFKEGEHAKKVPNQAGIYTDPGDGNWYNINSSSANLSKKQQERLVHLLTEVFE
jgi:hypothetical protein